jgi:CRISPR-associated protein Cas2
MSRANRRAGHWLVCYDIAEPRRLARLHRWLSRRAVAVQYSVFVARCDAEALGELVVGLAQRIDPRRDDVRLYPLEMGRPLRVLGQPLLAEGLTAPLLDRARHPLDAGSGGAIR